MKPKDRVKEILTNLQDQNSSIEKIDLRDDGEINYRWNDSEAKIGVFRDILTILIQPAFWLTWAFLGVYFIVIIWASYGGHEIVLEVLPKRESLYEIFKEVVVPLTTLIIGYLIGGRK